MKIVRKLLLFVFFLLPVSIGHAGDEPAYVVEDGLVDKATYNGYRRFHGTCHACHGQDALGSSFAPSLVDSLKTVDYELFVKTVTEGRQAKNASGAVSAMPTFGNDGNIMKHLDDLYRYIKARSDGALPAGRPKKIPK
jgi:mono/diheme cytochrome c family protein